MSKLQMTSTIVPVIKYKNFKYNFCGKKATFSDVVPLTTRCFVVSWTEIKVFC